MTSTTLEALRAAKAAMSTALAGRGACSDPGAECPLQDAGKPWHGFSVATQALDAAIAAEEASDAGLRERLQALVAEFGNQRDAMLQIANNSVGTISERCLAKASAWEGAHAQLAELLEQAPSALAPRPEIVCLCGSTRFIDLFAVVQWETEREGSIVVGCTLLPGWYCSVADHFGEFTGTKEQCDDLHKRKIELADRVIVVSDETGYYGESTRSEIAHAQALGKPVEYRMLSRPPAAPTEREAALVAALREQRHAMCRRCCNCRKPRGRTVKACVHHSGPCALCVALAAYEERT